MFITSISFVRYVITTVILVVLSVNHLAQGSSDNDILKRRLQAINLEDPTIVEAVSHIAVENKLPIGIESTFSSRQIRKDVNLPDGSVEECMDLLVSLFPDFEWSLVDNTINIYPKREASGLAEIQISRFQTEERSAIRIVESIFALPEVQEEMRRLQLRPFNISAGPSEGRILPEGFSLELRNVQLRTILNELARRSTNNYWILVRKGDYGELVSLHL